MIRVSLIRRLFLVVAIFMLVACQTSAVAQGCVSAMSALAGESDVEAPCHQTTDGAGDTGHQRECQSRCQSRDASFETAKLQLPAIDTVSLAMVFTTTLAQLSAGAAPNELVIERAAPPPLILVYCRLLI